MAKAARPTGLEVPAIGMTSAVDDMASASPSTTAAAKPLPVATSPIADQQRAAAEFGGADPEHLAPHRPQPLEAQFQPDREQQAG